MALIMFEDFQSTTVNKLFYNPEACQLIVQYKSGAQYRYNDISQIDWDNLCKAQSKGSFINQSIKSKPFQKMILTD